jgi:betaine reductase
MSKEFERRGIPTAVVSAIYDLALSSGANRVIKGVRIEHVVGDPSLGPDKDGERGTSIVRRALDALTTQLSQPTIFEAVAGPESVTNGGAS